MRKLIIAVITAIFMGTTVYGWAAPAQPKKALPIKEPVSNPKVHQINARLRTQMKIIMMGVKSGKFRKEQAKNLKLNLKSIQQKEMSFFKLNGKLILTPDQQSQLNQMLDANSAVLGETTTTSK